MFTANSPAPGRAGSRRPAQHAGANRQVNRNVEGFSSPPRTPRGAGLGVPQVGSPFSGQNISRNVTPLSTPRHQLRTSAFPRISPRRDVDMSDVHSEQSFHTIDAAAGAQVFANRPELSVYMEGRLPQEVQKVLETSDFQAKAFSGGIDNVVGFGYIISPEACFVWNCATTQSLYPTCYIFPVTDASNSQDSLLTPFASFVPYVSSREPGLLVASGRGELRFWDNISAGLSGAEHYHAVELDLGENEIVTGLERYEKQRFVIFTSAGRLLKLDINLSGGKAQLVYSAFGSSSAGTLARILSPLWAGAPSTTSEDAILAITFSQANERRERTLWVLTQTHLQMWKVVENAEQMVEQYDLIRPLAEKIMSQTLLTGSLEGPSSLGLEVLDIALGRDGQIYVLLCHPDQSRTATGYTYSVVRILPKHGDLIQSVHSICYDMDRDSRPGTAPRMLLADGGSAVLVLFGSAIVAASLQRGASFKETLTIKIPYNRTLGFALVKTDSGPAGYSDISVILAQNGLVTFKIDHAKIQDFHEDTPTNQLKATLEQAIFFGAVSSNPFLFSISSRQEGNLDKAACSLSEDILTSQSPLLRPALDLRTQLADRVQLLRTLILCINDNGLGSQLSTSGKRSLSFDAEKVVAARDMWNLVNSSAEAKAIVTNAVTTFMQKAGEYADEDIVRYFFRVKLDQLEGVVAEIYRTYKEYRKSPRFQKDGDNILFDVNKLFLGVYNSVLLHRNETKALYAIPQDDHRTAHWTSRPEQLGILNDLYDATSQVLADKTRQLGATGHHATDLASLVAEIRLQFSRYAELIFEMYGERSSHLQSLARETRDDRELQALGEQYTTVKKHVIDLLVDHSLGNIAFQLATKHQDYKLLARLCNDEVALRNVQLTSDEVSENYMQSYGEPFALELYQWYADHGQLQKLMLQNQHSDLVTTFFDHNPMPRVSWTHYIATGNVDRAVQSLNSASEKERDFLGKKVILSLEKLSELANRKGPVVINDVPALRACEDNMELMSIHETLYHDLVEIARAEADRLGRHAERSKDKAERVVSVSGLEQRPYRAQLFNTFVTKVFNGEVIPTEDLVDVLTFKPNDDPERNGFWEAFMVLRRSSDLQPGPLERSKAAIWRRAILCDNWDAFQTQANLTDDDIATIVRGKALYRLMKQLQSQGDLETFWLTPDEATRIPDLSDIMARYSYLSRNQAEELLQDYEAERQTLIQYIESPTINIENLHAYTHDVVLKDLNATL